MTNWATAIQGRTGTQADIFINVAKGLLGGATVYALSKTSRPGTWITVAGVAAPVIFVLDFAKNDEKLCYHGGGTAFLRGIQLGAAAYAANHGAWPLGVLANIDALALAALTKDVAFAYGLS